MLSTTTTVRRQTAVTVGQRLHMLGEAMFKGALLRERKRADRSNEPLALLLVSFDGMTPSARDRRSVATALSLAKRDTDVLGWFESGRTLGVIMPAVPVESSDFFEDVKARFHRALDAHSCMSADGRVSIEVHIHVAQSADARARASKVDGLLGEAQLTVRDRATQFAKRALDLSASLALLTLLSPLFAILAAIIKLKSPGPVFFRQERIGQRMKPFRMLKFRTMYVNNDSAVHQQFVSSFIKSGAMAQEAGKKGMFKLTNDPRITPIGGFLRKTSLDELPQLWNVVCGEMSLVGPRPPLAYEVAEYEAWHCRRVLEAKPGITGLWQVKGRSRTTFDEMVRLDLRYAKACSVWTDIKILLATPAAVFAGKGAA